MTTEPASKKRETHKKIIMPSILQTILQPHIIAPVVYGVLLCFLLRITKPVYKKFKRKKSGYGTVFDSITGEPIDLARVRLVDVHGLTVASAVTDDAGHYRLSVMPGEYTVEVSKSGYEFPSVFLKHHAYSRTYDNVLPTHKVKIKDYGIITKNIPMDPERGVSKRSNVFRETIVLNDNVQLTIAYVSPFAAAVLPILERTNYVLWGMFAIYVSIIVYRITHFLPGKPAYGTITDVESQKRIPKAVVRLYDAKFNKLLDTQITSGKGRYAFLVNRGAYYVTIHREGFRPVRLNFPNITKDSYPLATNVVMKRVEDS